MKKLTAICISLILVLASTAFCFADGLYEIDAQSGQIVDAYAGSDDSVEYVRLSSSCAYDKAKDMYVFTSLGSTGASFSCSVYNNMYTTDPVYLNTNGTTQLRVFLNGEELEFTGDDEFSAPGCYIVRDRGNSLVLSFTILNEVTNAVHSYEVPAIFYVASMSRDGEELPAYSNTIMMSEDGRYVINYGNFDTGVNYSLILDIDHTAPELEIIGVENGGYCQNAVSFGKRESGSTIQMIRDGEEVKFTDTIENSGTYEINYTDEAGNTSSYAFTVRPFLNTNAWFVVLLAAAIVLTVGIFMIYTRTHMRVR